MKIHNIQITKRHRTNQTLSLHWNHRDSQDAYVSVPAIKSYKKCYIVLGQLLRLRWAFFNSLCLIRSAAIRLECLVLCFRLQANPIRKIQSGGISRVLSQPRAHVDSGSNQYKLTLENLIAYNSVLNKLLHISLQNNRSLRSILKALECIPSLACLALHVFVHEPN